MGGTSAKVLATSSYAERGNLDCRSFMPIFKTTRGNMWLMKLVWLIISVTWMVSSKKPTRSEFYKRDHMAPCRISGETALVENKRTMTTLSTTWALL